MLGKPTLANMVIVSRIVTITVLHYLLHISPSVPLTAIKVAGTMVELINLPVLMAAPKIHPLLYKSEPLTLPLSLLKTMDLPTVPQLDLESVTWLSIREMVPARHTMRCISSTAIVER